MIKLSNIINELGINHPVRTWEYDDLENFDNIRKGDEVHYCGFTYKVNNIEIFKRLNVTLLDGDAEDGDYDDPITHFLETDIDNE